MKPGLCEIVVVMDRSGSMQSIYKDMEGGFDRFMADQRTIPGDCRVSLYQFDDPSGYEAVYEGRRLNDIPPCKLEPRGSTALLDAVAKTINAVGNRLRMQHEDERPEKLVFMVMTDGQENASVEFSRRKVLEMVEHQSNVYKWQFVYLGADAQAFAEAAGIGMKGVQYTANSVGTQAAYAGTSAAVMSFRSDTSSAATLNVDADLTVPETLVPGPTTATNSGA